MSSKEEDKGELRTYKKMAMAVMSAVSLHSRFAYCSENVDVAAGLDISEALYPQDSLLLRPQTHRD